MHHGQICFSTERIIVQRSIADKFQGMLVQAAENMPGSTAVAENIAQHALEVLEDAKAQGCKFIYGTAEVGFICFAGAVKYSLTVSCTVWWQERRQASSYLG